MDWIRDNLWEVWLAVAVLLGVAEMFSLDLVLLMLAGGALGGMAIDLVGLGPGVQVVVAVVVSIAMLGLIRPSMTKRLHGGPDLVLGHRALVGRQAVVLSDMSATQSGQIKVDGQLWSARPYDETAAIKTGETVDVLEIRGATAYVHPRPRLEP